ncbi:hypothetical protein BD626DRAFT_491897 [Schizophyllum amplum]|uniref:Trichome birefringence-like C-terminal domain-containing protein n=1 Tax=Schizophyllum amplum TaxID=97359 RepID=A0A550CI52_9AGAR|nr:hypothetical protein BD626DRAFT_491897 [Auriculariopsis ampla]
MYSFRRRSTFLPLFVLAALGTLYVLRRAPHDYVDAVVEYIPSNEVPVEQEFENEAYPPPPPAHPDKVEEVLAPPPPKHDFCKGTECGTGRWRARSPAFGALSELQKAYANKYDHVWQQCLIPASEQMPEAERKERESRRLVDVLNWEWVPSGGKLLMDFDALEFTIRMLKSPGGMILMGDSITRQWHVTMSWKLRQAGVIPEIDAPHLPHQDVPHFIRYTIHPNTPVREYLLKQAGVPESRLERPFLTMVENHLSIPHTDIRKITDTPADYPWDHKHPQVDAWHQYVKEMVAPVAGEEASVTEDSVVVMNTGAHWSRGVLYFLRRWEDPDVEMEKLHDAYRAMMRIHIDALGALPRLSVLYRSTAPGHPACERRLAPYADGPDAREKEADLPAHIMAETDDPDMKSVRRRWDWDQFSVHNEFWRAEIGRLMEERGKVAARAHEGMGNGVHGQADVAARAAGAKWYYLDIYDLSLQRPDAHDNPGTDCLHWCMPAVLDEWTRLLYHQLTMIEHGD